MKPKFSNPESIFSGCYNLQEPIDICLFVCLFFLFWGPKTFVRKSIIAQFQGTARWRVNGCV